MRRTDREYTEARSTRQRRATRPLTSDQRDRFEALDVRGDGIALLSCLLDGEPASVLVHVRDQEGEYIITPLYIEATDALLDRLTDPSGSTPTRADR